MDGSPCMAWQTKAVKSWILSWKRGRISFLWFRILFMDFWFESLHKVCTYKGQHKHSKDEANILAPGGIQTNVGNWPSDRRHQGPHSARPLWLIFVMVPRRDFLSALLLLHAVELTHRCNVLPFALFTHVSLLRAVSLALFLVKWICYSLLTDLTLRLVLIQSSWVCCFEEELSFRTAKIICKCIKS